MALTIPTVTVGVPTSPNAFPIAITQSPTFKFSDFEVEMGTKSKFVFIFNNAISLNGTLPITSAIKLCPSFRKTLISLASEIT